MLQNKKVRQKGLKIVIDGLMEWSRNIVCFSIFAVLIKNLLPGEKYAPYVQLYIGFMMLLVFFTPILKLFHADTTFQYLSKVLGGTLEIKDDAFLAEINENSNYKKQKEEYTKILEESVTDYLLEQLKEKKEWQNYRVEKTEVTWEEAEESEEFGKIMGIYLSLKRKEESVIEKEIVIDPITVEVLSKLEEQEGEEEKQLKNLLTEFYNLEEENITIRITE